MVKAKDINDGDGEMKASETEDDKIVHHRSSNGGYGQPSTPSTNGGSSTTGSAVNAYGKTQTVFIHKLYDMLEDKNISHLIWWAESNESFYLLPCEELAKVLSQYFKHTNIASFIRQLNMYGFHKVNDLFQGDGNTARWEFRHLANQFRKGDIESLKLIKRRSSKNVNPQKEVSNLKVIPTVTEESLGMQQVQHRQHPPQSQRLSQLLEHVGPHAASGMPMGSMAAMGTMPGMNAMGSMSAIGIPSSHHQPDPVVLQQQYHQSLQEQQLRQIFNVPPYMGKDVMEHRSVSPHSLPRTKQLRIAHHHSFEQPVSVRMMELTESYNQLRQDYILAIAQLDKLSQTYRQSQLDAVHMLSIVQRLAQMHHAAGGAVPSAYEQGETQELTKEIANFKNAILNNLHHFEATSTGFYFQTSNAFPVGNASANPNASLSLSGGPQLYPIHNASHSGHAGSYPVGSNLYGGPRPPEYTNKSQDVSSGGAPQGSTPVTNAPQPSATPDRRLPVDAHDHNDHERKGSNSEWNAQPVRKAPTRESHQSRVPSGLGSLSLPQASADTKDLKPQTGSHLFPFPSMLSGDASLPDSPMNHTNGNSMKQRHSYTSNPFDKHPLPTPLTVLSPKPVVSLAQVGPPRPISHPVDPTATVLPTATNPEQSKTNQLPSVSELDKLIKLKNSTIYSLLTPYNSARSAHSQGSSHSGDRDSRPPDSLSPGNQ